MPEPPTKVHLNSHPDYLRISGHSVYEDQDERTWLHVVMETEGVPQVRLRQEDIPSGHISLTVSPVTSSTMPLLWILTSGGSYVDHMYQFWRIVHHIKEDGVEEMILEQMENPEDM